MVDVYYNNTYHVSDIKGRFCKLSFCGDETINLLVG